MDGFKTEDLSFCVVMLLMHTTALSHWLGKILNGKCLSLHDRSYDNNEPTLCLKSFFLQTTIPIWNLWVWVNFINKIEIRKEPFLWTTTRWSYV